MRLNFCICIVFYGLLVNAQSNNNIFPKGYNKYCQLHNKNKQNLIVELGGIYNNLLTQDSLSRTEVVDFFIDTVLINDRINSSLTAKIMLQYIRLNELNIKQKEKLQFICDSFSFNLNLIQFIGVLDDTMFVPGLNKIKGSKKLNLNEYEKDVLLNTLARLGDLDAINDRVRYFKDIYTGKSMNKELDDANQFKSVHYINRKEIYDLLFDLIANNNNKIIPIGNYGGDPYGVDDNIYCTLSSFSAEILAEVVVGFPFSRLVCSDTPEENQIEIIQKWYANNMKYTIKKWHPYYGANYTYWP